MFRSIKNLTSAVSDMTLIAAKETYHQIDSANEFCTDVTRIIAWKAGMVRKSYEERLADRRRKTLAIEYIQEEEEK